MLANLAEGTWHWSGQERLTDYAIAQQAAPLLGIPIESVKPHVPQPQLKVLVQRFFFFFFILTLVCSRYTRTWT